MTLLGVAHGAGTWIGVALYAGLALLALRWAVRLADPGPSTSAPTPAGAAGAVAPASLVCGSCGAAVAADLRACRRCGARLRPAS